MWVEVLCYIDRVWSSKECACYVCDCSVHLSVPSIGFVYVVVCRKLSPHLRVSDLNHRCCPPYVVFLCCFFGMWCLYARSMILAVCMLLGMVV